MAPPRLPIPSSWYALGFSHDLPRGAVRAHKLAGHDLVLYRTESGQANAVDAFCPHLGAHLGIGGTVHGEVIRCPFHSFEFNTEGVCTATGYGTKPPPTARLQRWLLREINGLLLVWYDALGQPPAWEPPIHDTDGWTRPIYEIIDMRDHPQETVENGVDLGHFASVHNYSDAKMTADLEINGPFFRVGYAARRANPLMGGLGGKVSFNFDLRIAGLGYSLVEVTIPQYGAQARLYILATPTDGDRIHLHLGVTARKHPDQSHASPMMRLLPEALLAQIVARTTLAGLVHDVRQDMPIWENKKFVERPALAEGDGPIGKFRIWCRQFYPMEQPHTLPTEALPVLNEQGTPI